MTVGEALRRATAQLSAAGIESPQREARLLLAEAAGLDAATLVAWPERALPPEVVARLVALTGRRERREPLSKILGRREFWSLEFEVTADTLDPRPDTETLVEAALAHLPDRAAELGILDLGTGTGCILLALLSEYRAARGLGVDRSERAAKVALRNAARLGLGERARFIVGDWDAALDRRFDLVVSNPPYIPSATIARLDPSVREFDPLPALDGGADGLEAYRALASRLPERLAPQGIAVLEIGIGQAAPVATLLEHAGIEFLELRSDLAGIPRAIVVRALAAQK